MLNHPQLKDLVTQNDEECLMNLNEVDVIEFDDDQYQVSSPSPSTADESCVCGNSARGISERGAGI